MLGLGVSGVAAAELALRHGHAVHVLDAETSPSLAERAAALSSKRARVELGWSGEEMPSPERIIISPGVPPESPLGRLAQRLDAPVLGELEWGFLHCQCPVLAVTGTNGKTTTVEMVSHCLTAAGWTAPVAGNIGVPLSQAAADSSAADCIVCEVSSYQLETVQRFAPLASAILNITEDHMDRYANAADYMEAKLRLLDCSVGSRSVVLRRDLLERPAVRRRLDRLALPATTFSAWDQNADWHLDEAGMVRHRDADEDQAVLESRRLRTLGAHNVENAMATLALCEAVGVSRAETARHLQTYEPSPHRMQTVATWNGVRFVNDSKSTNPDSLIRALEATGDAATDGILLVAGGLDKGLVFDSVVPHLRERVLEAFLIGASRHRLAACWSHATRCRCMDSLEDAVDAAVDAARPGTLVLLSPGCASQDMFANYAERGTVFAELVKRRLL